MLLRKAGSFALRSVPVLDRAAADAVQRWRFAPARLNGVRVRVLLTVTVEFSRSG